MAASSKALELPVLQILSQMSLAASEDALALQLVVAHTPWMTIVDVAHLVATALVVMLGIATEPHRVAIIMMTVDVMTVLLQEHVGLLWMIIPHHPAVAVTMIHIVATILQRQTPT